MSPRTRSGFEYGHKPDGKQAKSAAEYVRAWRIQGALCAEAMRRAHPRVKWTCTAFDPGIELTGVSPAWVVDVSLHSCAAAALAWAMRELLTPSDMRRLLRKVPK